MVRRQPFLCATMTGLATDAIFELKSCAALCGRHRIGMTRQTRRLLMGRAKTHPSYDLFRLGIQQRLVRLGMRIELRPRGVLVLQRTVVNFEWLTRPMA
jgi:hypothetical protein